MSKRLPLRMMSALAATLIAFAGSDLLARAQRPDSRPVATGVTVHGHWTIDVRNPDGTLVSHTEFDNALHPAQGASLLAGLLTSEYSAGRWMIAIIGQNANPCVAATTPVPCSIVEPGSATPGPDVDKFTFQNLERSIPRHPATDRPLGTIGLAGFIKITNAAPGLSVAGVTTLNGICGNDRTPAACLAAISGPTLGFTSHTLATPIPVTFGQIVQVSVAISFS